MVRDTYQERNKIHQSQSRHNEQIDLPNESFFKRGLVAGVGKFVKFVPFYKIFIQSFGVDSFEMGDRADFPRGAILISHGYMYGRGLCLNCIGHFLGSKVLKEEDVGGTISKLDCQKSSWLSWVLI